MIRVLLKERFGATLVENSTRGAALMVDSRPDRILLLDGRDAGKILDSGSGFRLEPSASGTLRVDGVAYRGAVEVFINPLGVPVLINEVNLEDYSRGVVPNELGPRKFPLPEALKVQAVVSRTYAAYHLDTGSSRGFHAFSDTRSQVYRGISTEDPASDLAVLQTYGVIITYDGKPALALYSSTCGGKTGGYEEIFGRGGIPYLEGGIECSDTSSPYHSWEESIPLAKIRSSLESHGLGRLKDIREARHGPSGRLTEAVLIFDRGEKVLKGNQLRFSLGLRSNLVEEIEPVRDRDGHVREIRARGRGWGHGVGLCQIGAVEMARQGAQYPKILETYYRGIDLVKAYP